MVGPLPQPVKQLDGSPQQHVNCGPATAACGLSHEDFNHFIPSPTAIRSRGNMGPGGTDFAELKRGIEGFTTEFAGFGYQAPKLIRLGYVTFAELVQTLIQPSLFHVTAINYTPVIAQPEYAGDKSYTGNHFIGAVRIYEALSGDRYHRLRPRELGRVTQWLGAGMPTPARFWTFVLDPLADGRRPHIPQAPQLWPLALYLEAGDRFNDKSPFDGKLTAAVMPRIAKEVQP